MRPLLAALALAVLLVPPASAQGTQAWCDGAKPPVLFFEGETSLENLAFDGAGHLYLSDVGASRILVVGPDGAVQREIDLDAHGLVWGPDDRLYAVVTAGDAYDIQRSTDASVTQFEVYSRGVTTYNGMAFDAAGNLYVSDDSVAPPAEPPDLIRIPASDPMRWAEWTPLYGPNGLAYDEATGAMYTVITADQSSPVLRLSTTDPAAVEVVTYLSYGVATLQPNAHEPQGDPLYPVPKGLDDLALGVDGKLYITAHLSGELLRVDPATGEACLLAANLEEPTSARFAHGFGSHGGKLFVTTWGGTGVSGIALGQAGMHPPGKVWVVDVGLPEAAPGTGGPSSGPSTTGMPAPTDSLSDGTEAAAGKDTPLGLLAVVALLVVAFVRRRA